VVILHENAIDTELGIPRLAVTFEEETPGIAKD
jgi:hypothetical protein